MNVYMGQATIVLHNRSSAAQAALDRSIVVTEDKVPNGVQVVLSPIHSATQNGSAVEIETMNGSIINLEKADLEYKSL